MQLSLHFFPVCYPPAFDAEEALQVSGTGGECPLEITFQNDFHAPRRLGRPHHAIDIFGATGLHILATTGGTVVQHWQYSGTRASSPAAGKSEGGGYYVRLIDDQGYVHSYTHLHLPPLVRSGDRVEAGQLIGLMGQSGLASGSCPHLHYQIKTPMLLSRKRSYSIYLAGSYYSTRGGEALNPCSELARLCRAVGGRCAGGTCYSISIPAEVIAHR